MSASFHTIGLGLPLLECETPPQRGIWAFPRQRVASRMLMSQRAESGWEVS